MATLTTLSTVFPLLLRGSLFCFTSDHSYFFIILDSVSYLTWIIAVIKGQKQVLINGYIRNIKMHYF